MIFAEHVKIREEKFGAVVFETLNEKIFVTNQTGKDILHLLEEGKSINEIVKLLGSSYATEPEKIREDVNSFINQLKVNNIIKSNELS